MERLLVVLDLDETLIHATSRDDIGRPADFEVFELGVFRRPRLQAFLDACFANYFVGVWTSSGSEYAAEIVKNIMDPGDLHFLWSHERCGRRFDPELLANHPTKPLRKLVKKGYSKERIVAIDDSPEKWVLSYGNLLQIEAFRGNSDDDELMKLAAYLDRLKDAPDIRAVEKRAWRSAQKWVAELDV